MAAEMMKLVKIWAVHKVTIALKKAALSGADFMRKAEFMAKPMLIRHKIKAGQPAVAKAWKNWLCVEVGNEPLGRVYMGSESRSSKFACT